MWAAAQSWAAAQPTSRERERRPPKPRRRRMPRKRDRVRQRRCVTPFELPRPRPALVLAAETRWRKRDSFSRRRSIRRAGDGAERKFLRPRAILTRAAGSRKDRRAGLYGNGRPKRGRERRHGNRKPDQGDAASRRRQDRAVPFEPDTFGTAPARLDRDLRPPAPAQGRQARRGAGRAKSP